MGHVRSWAQSCRRWSSLGETSEPEFELWQEGLKSLDYRTACIQGIRGSSCIAFSTTDWGGFTGVNASTEVCPSLSIHFRKSAIAFALDGSFIFRGTMNQV